MLMKWIASFLTERTQQVKLCNTQSDWNYIHGWVPQGTKLGPVLFVLMINDLHAKCDPCKCVDDTCIDYTGSDSQAPNLQEAADAAYLWTIQNGLNINKRKTKELVIDFSKTRTNFPTIRIDRTDTQRVTEAKVLGITITSNPDMGRTRWWNNTKSRQEAVSTVTTQTIRHSRWIPSDGIYNGGPAYSGIRMSSMADLTHIASPNWYGACTKTCYEHHIPEPSLYRSISECTAAFSERETCAVMWTCLHTNRTAAAQTA